MSSWFMNVIKRTLFEFIN